VHARRQYQEMLNYMSILTAEVENEFKDELKDMDN
jgi:hypothetical protein